MYRAADPAAAVEMAETRSGLVAEQAAGPRKVSTLVSGSAIEDDDPGSAPARLPTANRCDRVVISAAPRAARFG